MRNCPFRRFERRGVRGCRRPDLPVLWAPRDSSICKKSPSPPPPHRVLRPLRFPGSGGRPAGNQFATIQAQIGEAFAIFCRRHAGVTLEQPAEESDVLVADLRTQRLHRLSAPLSRVFSPLRKSAAFAPRIRTAKWSPTVISEDGELLGWLQRAPFWTPASGRPGQTAVLEPESSGGQRT